MNSDIALPNGVLLKTISTAPHNDYMAGSDGKVYSRIVTVIFGVRHCGDWNPLRGHISRNGYRYVSLYYQGKKKNCTAHRLICAAFHGAPTLSTLQVRHLDGNRLNNHPDNLKWGTQAENYMDMRGHGRVLLGENHPHSKFTNVERDHIRWCVIEGICSRRHLARLYGVDSASIQDIVNGQSRVATQTESEA